MLYLQTLHAIKSKNHYAVRPQGTTALCSTCAIQNEPTTKTVIRNLTRPSTIRCELRMTRAYRQTLQLMQITGVKIRFIASHEDARASPQNRFALSKYVPRNDINLFCYSKRTRTGTTDSYIPSEAVTNGLTLQLHTSKRKSRQCKLCSLP